MKYRIWDKNSGYFIKDTDTNKHYLSPNGDIIIIDEIGFIYETDKENYIINNYAGLKDSKGYEIFEDDIVWNEYDKEQGAFLFIKYTRTEKIIDEEEILLNHNNLNSGIKEEWLRIKKELEHFKIKFYSFD